MIFEEWMWPIYSFEERCLLLYLIRGKKNLLFHLFLEVLTTAKIILTNKSLLLLKGRKTIESLLKLIVIKLKSPLYILIYGNLST